jgi:tripartite-type tricarboxylate transporter receptor subunit TctC
MTGVTRIIRSAAVVLGAACVLATPPARAEDYPAKPVRIIMPFLAGGPADVATRIVAQGLNDLWGQPVIVDNRPGAGGNLGSEMVAKATPDGYTLGIASNTTSANVSLYKTLPFDTLKSFAYISVNYRDANILVVNPSLPVTSVKELIALAKAKPGLLTYSSSGNGTSTHLSGALFNSMAGTKITHVPYKGVPPAITDVISGQVSMMFASSAIVAPFVRDGKLKALGVTGAKHLPAFPDLPTIAEAALPGFESTTWTGFMAPAGTPPEIIAKISSDTIKVLNTPAIRAALEKHGFEVVGSTPQETTDLIKYEIGKWGDLIRASGATVD